MYDSIVIAAHLNPDGIVYHVYSDVTVMMVRTNEGYSLYSFTRYGDIIEFIDGLSLASAINYILHKWGYPYLNWRGINGFSIPISERPADCTPPHGRLWKAMHPDRSEDG